jgi:pyruvate-ferredoxin/flavodoxin oxidoreductase
VASGIWPLYRYDPRRIETGEPPLVLDAKPSKVPVGEYMSNEARFRMVEKLDPQRFRQFAHDAQTMTDRRIATYQHMAQLTVPADSPAAATTEKPAE